MSTSVTAPVTVATPGFSGVSKFASSLQQVLTRAVGIASLPLNSLEAGLTTLNNQQSALQGIDTAFLSLQSSITTVQNAVSSGLKSSSVSDGSILSANVSANAAAGTYTVEVDNLGSYSTALGSAGSAPVTDPAKQGVSSAGSFTLTVGSSAFTITPASTDLQDLANAINSQAGTSVQATLVNVGSNSAPDYRLSLSAVQLGAAAIGLTDSAGANLIASSSAGALASYKVDGTASVTSDSRTVTLSPGLTVTLLGQSTVGQPATITVQNDPSSLVSAFNNFAQAYNAAATAVSQQRGQNNGPLEGDSLLDTLGATLSQLATYSDGSPSSALANYGITVDKTGQLSVDSTAFTTAADASFSGLLSAIGDSSSGGFLQTATNLLNNLEDPTTGLIRTEETSLTTQIGGQQTKIADQQNTVNQLQTSLTAQIASADSSIAQLESQVSYVTGLFAQYTGATNTQSNVSTL